MAKHHSNKPPSPRKEELLAFIGEQPGKVGTREIARAFGLKNADRAELKRMLRELADEGHVERRRKKLHHAGALPPVVLADITGRDRDGELIAAPTEWDEERTARRRTSASPRRARRGPARSPASATARCCASRRPASDDDPLHRPRHQDDRPAPRQRVLGIFRALPDGGGRLVPIDKKQLGRELAIPRERDRRTRRTAIWSPSRSRARAGFGLPTARGRGAARLAQERDARSA